MSHFNKYNNRHKVYVQQFAKCHYCDEYGHFEDTCSLVKKAAEDLNCKMNISKEPLSNTCTECGSPYHTTNEHLRMKSLEDKYSMLVNLTDYCGICEERGHEMFDCKRFNDAKSKDKQEEYYKEIYEKSKENQTVGMCFICKTYGHKTTNCPIVINLGPEQHEYDKQWYVRQHYKKQKENNSKNNDSEDLENKKSKKCNDNGHPSCSAEKKKTQQEQQEYKQKLDFNIKAYTSLMEYCHICEERGHDVYDCELFLQAEKEQKDYDKQWRKEQAKKKSKENNGKNHHKSKHNIKCSKCNKNGHTEDSCYSSERSEKTPEKYNLNENDNGASEAQSNTSKKSHPEFKKIFFPMTQKSIHVSENGKILKICTVHCVCEMCHTKHSSKLNKKTTENHSIDKGPDDDAIRCCFMCGANGLMDSCFWKKSGHK